MVAMSARHLADRVQDPARRRPDAFTHLPNYACVARLRAAIEGSTPDASDAGILK